MDDQNNQVPQDPQVAPQPELNPENSSSTKKALITALLIIILLGGALGGFWWFMMREKPAEQPSTAPPAIFTTSNNPVFCTSVGVDSMQCENIDSKEVIKYDQPKIIQDNNSVVPSPDGTKYGLTGWKDGGSQQHETLTVVDSKFKPILEPKAKQDIHGQEVEWIDNDALLYTTIKGSADQTDNDTVTTLYSFNVDDGTSTELMKVDATLESYDAVGDGTHVYAIRGISNKATQSVDRDLVVLNLQSKTMNKVNTDGLSLPNIGELIFSTQNGKFFQNSYSDADKDGNQTFWTVVYGVDSLDTEPKMKELQKIDNIQVAPTAPTTSKGVFATLNGESYTAPYTIYMATDQKTSLEIVPSGYPDFAISLPAQPNLPKAEDQEVTVNDFVQVPKGAPKKISDFVNKLAADYPDCKDDEYSIIVVDDFDGDAQFSAWITSCSDNGLAYFIYKDGAYKKHMAGSHGMSCEVKQRLGISDAVLPPDDCRNKNDPL